MTLVRTFIALAALSAFSPSAVRAEKKASIADCTYSRDPDEFLSRQARIRSATYTRAAKLSLPSVRSSASADTIPQRNLVDREIFGKLNRSSVPSAPLSSDEEFLRRIYLDLTGRIPASDDVRAFLADTNKDKRDAVIDSLLTSQEFVDRWTMWMGDWLQNTSTLVNASVNRTALGRNAFYAYIRDAVNSDKSLRTVAAEVIAGKGNNFDAASGAANYPLAASTSMGPVQDTYDTMLAKTAATFLGIGNYDCLLCHNGRGHLNLVSLWGTGQVRTQAQGMAAFFSRMTFTPSPDKSTVVADASGGAYNLNTNFGNRPDRTPVGSVTVITPSYRETGAEPQSDDWRAAFAENMAADPMFARNIANRLWKQVFGLALIDPVDSLDPLRLDPANPPPTPWDLQATHPELLEALAAELAKGNFHLRGFLRTLVQSSAYQLSSHFDGEWKEEYVTLFARHYSRRMEAEEVHDAIAKATGVLGSYRIQGWAEPVQWAMRLPEPVEPQSDATANNFLNAFLRGDRDTQDRSQSGSIQQQLFLMNDAFVVDRVKLGRSPRLQAIAQISSNTSLIEEMYLAFLSRMPTAQERSIGVAFLAKAGTDQARNSAVEDLAWMCVNKVEFLFSY